MDDINLDLFPDDWDIDNENHFNYYKKCSPYQKNPDDFDNIINKSKIFYIYGFLAIIYFITLSLMLLKHRNHFIFKRQGRIYFLLYMIGSTLSSTNSFMVQIKYKVYPCIIHNLLLSIGYPLSFFSYSMIILTNFKNYYNSQIAYIEMFQGSKRKKDKDNKSPKYIFTFIYKNMPQSTVTPFIIYYLTFKWIVVYILYFYEIVVSQNGFCRMSVIHIPQITEIFIFMLLFLPLALIEVLKFDDTFKMKNKIILSILTIIACTVGYMSMSVFKRINCSVAVKYMPSDGFVILLFVLSSMFLCFPILKDIIHIDRQKAETKATQNGMLKMLEDNVLLREFGEFCRKENCTENILFYKKYWKFRKLFDGPEKNSKIVKSNYYNNHNNSSMLPTVFDYEDHDHITSMMSFEVPPDTTMSIIDEGYNASMINGIDPSIVQSEFDVSRRNYFGGIGRKITRNDILLKEANNIMKDFILNDGKFEVNISDKVKKNIIINLKDIKNNELQQHDFKEKLKCLFDDAYNEVINSLFLNSYTNYIAMKKNIGNEKV